MLNQKKITVVMPAYQAEKTLEKTLQEFPEDLVDSIILVDDCSTDNTVQIAKQKNLKVLRHNKNQGYGGNQKTCYAAALSEGADIIVMIHPDYQYSPKFLRAMVSMIVEGGYDVCFGSRILGKSAVSGGMPIYKYIANRILTGIENFCIRQKISEYHTGYRAYTREVLLTLPMEHNSNDFIFDNQVILQTFCYGFTIGEVSIVTRYFKDSSSINFLRSCRYGLAIFKEILWFVLSKWGIYSHPRYQFKNVKTQRGNEAFLQKRAERWKNYLGEQHIESCSG